MDLIKTMQASVMGSKRFNDYAINENGIVNR